VTAVADPDLARRSAAAGAAAACETHRELLARPDVDAVVVSAPTGLHADIAREALGAGKHVYLEKPLAASAADGRAVLAAWRRSGRVGMIGFNYRFNDLYRRAAERVQGGELGELASARTVFSTSPGDLAAWKRARSSGGGVLLDLASHHVDLVRFVFGREVRRVFAAVWSQRSEDDSATLHLELEGGPLVQSFFSLASVEEDRLEVYGSRGKLVADRYASLDVEIVPPVRGRGARLAAGARRVTAWRRAPYLLRKLRSPLHEPSFGLALTQFVRAVRGEAPPTPDFDDGYRSLAVVEAAERAARTGTTVAPEGEPTAAPPDREPDRGFFPDGGVTRAAGANRAV
jgi:predicted dehydrogenase